MIKLKQYKDPWLAEGVNDYIGFYNREFFCLDNFSSFAIMYKGELYPTVEHAYQAGKFAAHYPAIAIEIRGAISAYESKKIAERNLDKKDPDFDNFKVSLMEELLRLKLEQHPYVKTKLLETENYPICEDSPKDTFWGIGKDKNGRNELGKLWVKLREELRQ
ncbi:MAG: NADAR family protein [Firmicutes bacterium]|nr:NADAR family protein [Bacillota bacterium]